MIDKSIWYHTGEAVMVLAFFAVKVVVGVFVAVTVARGMGISI